MEASTWLAELQDLWSQALTLWRSGGWAMFAIAGIALVMFGVGVHIGFSLRDTGLGSVSERTWRGWLDRPDERRGPIGELLDAVSAETRLSELTTRFAEERATRVAPFERDLRVMRVCVSAAPLVGLLGTVTGMLATFRALAEGSGGDKTMALVAGGISEALVTTETGLVIALPGLFLLYHLTRRFEVYKAFLGHVETVCTQKLHRSDSAGRRRAAQRKAARQIASRLETQLRKMRSACSPDRSHETPDPINAELST